MIDEEGTQPSDAHAGHPSAAHAQQEPYPRPTAVPPLADAPAAQGQPAQDSSPSRAPHWDSGQDARFRTWPGAAGTGTARRASSPTADLRPGQRRRRRQLSGAAGRQPGRSADSQARHRQGPARSGHLQLPRRDLHQRSSRYAPPTPLPAGEGPYITPLVRKLAIEHGVDLGSVEGSGVGGRIRKQDVVEAARAMRPPQAATPAGPAGAWLTRASRAPLPRPPTPMSATAPPATGPAGTAPAAPAARRARRRRPSRHRPRRRPP